MTKKNKKRKSDRRRRLALLFAMAGVLLLLRMWPETRPSKVSNTEALARVIRSEIGIGTAKQKLHVAWVVRNLASSRGQTVVEMACSPCGAQGSARPVASGQEAQASDRALARRVLRASSSADPTGGGTHFINPKLQDQLAKSRRPGYRGNSYRKVRRRWRRQYHWEPYYRLGPTLEIWGKKRRSRKGKR